MGKPLPDQEGLPVCPLCEGDGEVIQGISIYARDHAYPEIVTCPDCGGTGRASEKPAPDETLLTEEDA